MARFSGGWIKLWRKAIEGDLPSNVYLWAIWNWLLYSATWKSTKILWNGHQREVPPGTVVMGLSELATKWECSKNTIKKWLNYLEQSERISIESCTRGTLVTIRNWGLYQSQEVETCTPSEHEVNADCTQAAREVTLSEEVRKKKRSVEPKETTLLWNYYKEELKKQKNLDSIKSGAKENTHCKNLIEEFGLEKAKKLVLEFFKDKDPFVADAAYQIGLLFAQRQKYLARISKSSGTERFTFEDSTAEASHA